MAYFTILHLITLLILLVIFILLCVVALKQKNRKIIIPMLFSNFLVIITLAIFSMLVLDKYTKKARLENVTQKRILRTESLTISGKIRNVGNFDIGRCILEVKIVSNAISSGTVTGSNVFSPSSGWDFFFGNDEKKSRPTTVVEEFVIASNFQSGQLKNFSVSLRYPPYFAKPYLNYELYCR